MRKSHNSVSLKITKTSHIRHGSTDKKFQHAIIKPGASLNPQLSGEVRTPVGPQTFMGLVGHHYHPCTKETFHESLQFLALCRSAGV